MLIKNYGTYVKIINYWLSYILLLAIISNLPHENIPILSWFNFSIYFLLFLHCIFIIKKERHNKSIFLNLGLFLFFYSFSFVPQYISDNYLYYYVFAYRKIFLSFLLSFSIIYICIKYLFNNRKSSLVYVLSFAVIVPIYIWHFYPYLLDKDYILVIEDLSIFYKSILEVSFLPLFFVIFYALLLYRYDRSLGEHINSLMVCFFIMTLLEITDIFGYIYNIKLFSLSQYILLLNLSFFLITLFRKLNYIYSEFGQFYDTIVITGKHMGVPIKRKRSSRISLFAFSVAKAYFHEKRNTFGFITFLFMICINYFNFYPFLKLNIIVLFFGALLLIFYLTALYQKRSQNGELLNFNRKSN